MKIFNLNNKKITFSLHKCNKATNESGTESLSILEDGKLLRKSQNVNLLSSISIG